MATVTWPALDVSDNSGDVEVLASEQNGSDFHIGITTVVYTARDQSGNEASCAFKITIIGGYI